MLVHRRITPSIKFAGTHSYTWVERGTVGVKCLAQEHNTMSPARAQTRTACSGVERTNHEATAPPTATKLCPPTFQFPLANSFWFSNPEYLLHHSSLSVPNPFLPTRIHFVVIIALYSSTFEHLIFLLQSSFISPRPHIQAIITNFLKFGSLKTYTCKLLVPD